MTKPIYDWDTDIVYLSDKLEVFFNDFFDRLIKKFGEMEIPYGVLEGTKDIWCRDYMPIQIQDNIFVGYDYNPDYLNEYLGYPCVETLKHLNGRELRTVQKEVWEKNGFNYELVDSNIVLDGGNVVVCDEYVILTNKIYTANSCESESEKADFLQRLSKYFGNRKPLIIPWKPVGDDVYGHSDGMVKFQKREWNYKPYALMAPLTKKDAITQFEALGKEFYLDFISIPPKIRNL